MRPRGSRRRLDALERIAAMEQRFGIGMDWESLPTLLERHNLRPAAS
jgi:hypothetical protein